MKTIKNKMSTATFTLMVILCLPFAASAADMWAETPDLNGDTGSPSLIAEPHTFKFEPPRVDMWAETPALSAGREDHGVKIDGEYRFVNNFESEMYVETPGLNDIPSRPQPETMESTLLAKEK
jgi:hypothetical protein